MEPLTFIVTIIILIMSVVIHELSHGYVAELLGDPTPRLQGRLTINPIKHLELFGSFIVPIITSLAGFTFGWARPIEWNPYNVKNKRWGELLISIAGPFSNLLVAIIFGLVLRFGVESFSTSFVQIAVYVVIINIALAVFNLLPVPPLDGSKIFFSFLPPNKLYIRHIMERNSLVLFLILIIFLWRFVEPIILIIFNLIVGN